jgi:hypothetical protein
MYAYMPLIFTAFFPDFDAVTIDTHMIYTKSYGYVYVYVYDNNLCIYIYIYIYL